MYDLILEAIYDILNNTSTNSEEGDANDAVA